MKGRIILTPPPREKNPALSGLSGQRNFGREDSIILVCHVIFQNHVIRVSCDFMGMNPSR